MEITNPSAPLVTLEEVLAYMRVQFPKGFTMSASGEFTNRAQVGKLTSFESFSELALSPKDLTFDLHGTLVTVQVRGLATVEAADLDEMPEAKPPMRQKLDEKKRPIPGQEVADWEDEKFRAETTRIFELKRAIIISKGLVGISVPGDTPEQKRDELKKAFPPHVLELLRTKILSMTSEPIVDASFT